MVSAEKARVLYCYPKRSTFIERDLIGLSERFDVRDHELRAQPAWRLPLRLLHQFFWLIGNRSWTHDCICHFSGYHALLPTLLCRRTFIILAGSDCASIPAIAYGNHTRRLLGWATRAAAAHATRLLPVHESLILRTQSYADIVPRHQGLRAFAPKNIVPWSTVPYGFDPSFWSPGEDDRRDPLSFVCVPGPASPTNRLHVLKGVDLVLEIAGLLPEARFKVVGLADISVYPDAPGNVEFIGRVDPERLRSLYRSSGSHLQLSLSEGMPNALCEAMLCGCIPLVSDVSSMPDIVEGCGLVLEHRDAAQGALACSTLIALRPEQRAERSRAARERVKERYSPERRMSTLTGLLTTEG